MEGSELSTIAALTNDHIQRYIGTPIHPMDMA